MQNSSGRGPSSWYFLACLVLPLLVCGRGFGIETQSPDLNSEGIHFFEREIRPVLVEHCYRCHSAAAERVRGRLFLDSEGGMLKGGFSGPAVVRGRPGESLLIKAVRQQDPDLKMPPGKKLPDAVITALEKWVTMGAPDPRKEPMALPFTEKAIDFKEARRFWSFQPVREPSLPSVKNSSWIRTPIDRFILAALETKGLQPAGPADRSTWIRRATFDLIGLPPTPAEMEAFQADLAVDAYEKVVDRLLASPQYGERWGRHWLDLVRYADTSGCNSDFPVPEAYRYRNYVIQSFNRDKPYDQFIREQVAGDLLPSSSSDQRHEQIIATGFLALSRRFSSGEEENHLTIENSIDTLGKAFLGLSISCARCHDHKFDPIPTKDYYSLYGILKSTRYAFPGTELIRWPRDLYPLVATQAEEKTIRAHLDEMAALDREYRALREKPKFDLMGAAKRRDEFVKKSPTYEKAYAVFDGDPENARVQIKGDPKRLGPEVPRRFLQVLGGQELPATEQGSGRRQLGDWLTDPANPLTARVMVNRLWLYHFGKGIVASPNDFGNRGQRPTNPELLDYLAARFTAQNWSIKAMQKLIMLSATYQMACTENPVNAQIDPGNEFLWKFNRQRLEAEEIRDAMLAISGTLDYSMAGRHPFPPEQQWRYTQHNPFYGDYDNNRRSVYQLQQRLKKQPLLEVFDGADPNATIPERQISTTPLQALFMMNSLFAHTQAEKFAERILSGSGTTSQRIDHAYRLALSRPPSTDEVTMGEMYLTHCTEKLKTTAITPDNHGKMAWASYLRIIFSSDEFIFVE